MNTPNPMTFAAWPFWQSILILGKTPQKYYFEPPYSPHSHSIVPGGFDVMSYTTRLTPLTSLMIRVAVSPRNFMSNA